MEVLKLPPPQKKGNKKQELIACDKDICYWMV